ncbi:MAG TPA: AarF/UbiB family protein [Bryobacteraceae bacterium]|nr:AarF/UbiB family protein [Bryobacteraceae bacterium]
MHLPALASFLATHTSSTARTAAVKTALLTPAGRMLRDELGSWVIRLLPAETVVPEVYAAWRPLVRDAMLFMISHLSAARLAPKLVEQIELPPETTPEARLLHLIAKVPGLQKIGQVLAHNRHFHPSLRDALSELENGIRDVSPEETGALIRKQLGSLLDTYAVEIEPGLLAEASVSAVVRFTWRNPENGERERGVFKVLKPFVSACFAEDLDLLQQLAHYLAEKHPEYGRALPETIMEVRCLLEHEVDFEREQATLAEAARVYRGVRGVRVPRLIEPLSTGTITALSEEEGVKVTAALADASDTQRRRAAEQLIEALVAVPLFARGERTIFHADPHAGNLLYDEGSGELVLLDWALTETLTAEQRRHVAILALMLGLRDPVGICGEIEALALGRRLSAAHRNFMREQVDRFLGRLPLSRLPGSMDAMRLLDRLALEGIRFPPGLMMFRKVLFTLDGILHDIAAPNLRMDLTLARHMLARSPLSLFDWIGVEASALLYGARLWVQWAQAALSRAEG